MVVVQNYLNSGWSFSEDELFLKHRFNMVNITLFFGFVGLTQGMVYNFINHNLPLIAIESFMYLLLMLLIWQLRKDKKYYETVTTALAVITLIFFDLLILFSKPDDFKFVWLFVYSTVFIFFKGNRNGPIWLAVMYFTIFLLALQPYVPLAYSTSQLFYFVFVSLILNAIVIFFQYVMENSQRIVLEQKRQLLEKNRILGHISITDQLTGLYNRSELDRTLEREYQRTIRYGNPSGLILLDIDHFKKINDTHGHLVGDDVLFRTAKVIRENIRESDIVGRWGGEEFMIICPGTDLEELQSLSEHIRSKISGHRFPLIDRHSASLGITMFRPEDTIETVIKRADDALYCAKHSGRNCVKSC